MNSLIPSGAHLFVDESKSKAYYVAASVIAPAEVVGARRAIAALRRAGQRRVHFKSESDSSRNAFLNGAIQAGLQTRLYVARHMPDKTARPLCLERLLDDLMAAGALKLVLTVVSDPQPGDMVVQPGHVGIYVGDGQVLSSGLNGKNETAVHPLSWMTSKGAVTFVRAGA